MRGVETTSLHHEGIKISLRPLHNKKNPPSLSSFHRSAAPFWGCLWRTDSQTKTLKAQPKPGKEKLNLLPKNCPPFFSQSTPATTDSILCPKISPLLLPFHKEIGSKSIKSPFFFIPGHICSQILAATSQWSHPCRACE